MPTRSVQTVAEMAIENGAGQPLVFDTVASAFDGFAPSDAHRMVSDFNWRAIATTNYDLFLEAAYGDAKRRRQVLLPFVKDDEPIDTRKAQSQIHSNTSETAWELRITASTRTSRSFFHGSNTRNMRPTGRTCFTGWPYLSRECPHIFV